MISYRKTKKGDWVVFGPASEVVAGTVTVTKKGGAQKTEVVASVGRTFNVDGVPHVYGYLAEKSAASTAATPSYRRRSYDRSCHTDGNCSSVCSSRGGSCPCAEGGWFTCC